MKRSKRITMIAAGLSWLVIISTAKAQVNLLDTLTLRLKSPGKAATLSLLSTAVPIVAGSAWANNSGMGSAQIALIGSGIVLGPSVGYFYGRCSRKGLSGTIKRTGVAVFTMFIVESRWKELNRARIYRWLSADPRAIVPYAVGIIGCSIIAVQAVSDLTRVKSAVEDRNERLACRDRKNVWLIPAYLVDSGAAGLSLNIVF